MSYLLKVVGLLAISCLIAGCKIAVLVVEGGHVESTSNQDCLEGAVCIIEVSDHNFSETFTAVPKDGWYFVKWNSGGDFLCQESTSEQCVLSNVGTSDDPVHQAMVSSDMTVYLMPVFKYGQAINNTIVADGKEWAPPSTFLNLSWNEINEVCPQSYGGVCGYRKRLNGYDMDGWRWAEVRDVNSLFNSYGATPPFPVSNTGAELIGESASFIANLADLSWGTYSGNYFGHYVGWGIKAATRTRKNSNKAVYIESFNGFEGRAKDSAATNVLLDITAGTKSTEVGAFFYKYP